MQDDHLNEIRESSKAQELLSVQLREAEAKLRTLQAARDGAESKAKLEAIAAKAAKQQLDSEVVRSQASVTQAAAAAEQAAQARLEAELAAARAAAAKAQEAAVAKAVADANKAAQTQLEAELAKAQAAAKAAQDKAVEVAAKAAQDKATEASNAAAKKQLDAELLKTQAAATQSQEAASGKAATEAAALRDRITALEKMTAEAQTTAEKFKEVPAHALPVGWTFQLYVHLSHTGFVLSLFSQAHTAQTATLSVRDEVHRLELAMLQAKVQDATHKHKATAAKLERVTSASAPRASGAPSDDALLQAAQASEAQAERLTELGLKLEALTAKMHADKSEYADAFDDLMSEFKEMTAAQERLAKFLRDAEHQLAEMAQAHAKELSDLRDQHVKDRASLLDEAGRCLAQEKAAAVAATAAASTAKLVALQTLYQLRLDKLKAHITSLETELNSVQVSMTVTATRVTETTIVNNEVQSTVVTSSDGILPPK